MTATVTYHGVHARLLSPKMTAAIPEEFLAGIEHGYRTALEEVVATMMATRTDPNCPLEPAEIEAVVRYAKSLALITDRLVERRMKQARASFTQK